jgi:carbon-monoxide dehydrogenase medium subunit
VLPRPGLPSFTYLKPDSYEEVTRLLLAHGTATRLLMGGTDLLAAMRDGAVHPEYVVDIKHLPGMQDIIYNEEKGLVVGAAATMNQIAEHPDVQIHYPLLAEAAHSVASYQLRNRATIGGNLANASPCADTAPAVLVLGGRIVLHGPDGERRVAALHFFLGPGETAMQPGEFVTAIEFGPAHTQCAGRYLKLGRTRGGDLALVSVAVFAFPANDVPSGYRFRIALGSVAPFPLRTLDAEKILSENAPGEETYALAAQEAMAAASPIDDVRASAAYRRAMVRNLTLRGLTEVGTQLTTVQHSPAERTTADSYRQPPPTPQRSLRPTVSEPLAGRSLSITTTVNGEKEGMDVAANMTLLQLLREKLALTGTKNGCAAGECGACTVLMNGDPVNACMVLAVEADGAEITTVEGLSEEEKLSILQQAFVDEGAVQCGFCTPGMLISAKALLERHPNPDEEEIREALVGHLCRCTGYTRIVQAVKTAAQSKA